MVLSHVLTFPRVETTKRVSRGVGADGSSGWEHHGLQSTQSCGQQKLQVWPARKCLAGGVKSQQNNAVASLDESTAGTQLYLRSWLLLLWTSNLLESSLILFRKTEKGGLTLLILPPNSFLSLGEILSLSTSEFRTGFWERDDVSMPADDPLKFRHGLCCCQSSPRDKGYLNLFIPLSFPCGCDRALTEAGRWARGNFGLIQDDHSNSFLWALPQSSKQCSQTWFSFAEAGSH